MASPFQAATLVGSWVGFPAVADFNKDGLLEPLGFLNRGDGTFSNEPSIYFSSVLAHYPGRVNRDNRVLDIDGDGNLDVIWNVYSDPSSVSSFTLIFYGDGLGGYSRYEERRDIDGFGETIVAADFNNDGRLDVYIPAYAHLSPDTGSYLLLNENGVLGPDRALEWGVSLSYLAGVYRVEGAQAADANFDGLIDLYVGSHLFTNVDATHFVSTTLNPFVFDEGASLIDYDNDGDFDLVLRMSYSGNASVRLYEWTGLGFEDRGLLGGDGILDGYGLKVGDLDSNGWQDIVFASSGGLITLLNEGGIFTRVDSEVPVSIADSYALFDHNGDGDLDVLLRSAPNLYVFENSLQQHRAITFDLRDASGAQNQHGRSILLVSADDPTMRLARSVESGSGYMGQDQYVLQTGLPSDGAFVATIPFAELDLTFTVSRGQKVTAFADGKITIVGSALNDVMGGASAADSLFGGDGNDLIISSGGADVIDGGNGADTLDYSLAGSAIKVDLAAEQVILGSEIQAVTHIENIIGTRFGDSLAGGAGANRLAGGAGDDLYFIGSGDSAIEEVGRGFDEVRTSLAAYNLPSNIEKLTGLNLAGQILNGNDLANILSGTGGPDTFRGGAGDDIYITDANDIVYEDSGNGHDQVRTAASAYVLPDNVEDLFGTSDSGQNLTGNGAGNRMSGGSGTDTFRGGGGNDQYTVSTGDIVIEAAAGGIDEVRTDLVNYILTDNVEYAVALRATGQKLVGNAGNNKFSSIWGAAPDVFEGRGGDDIYLVGAYDQVIEAQAEGIDEVRTDLARYTLPDHVENLVGTAPGAQKLTGNNVANIIVAPSGFDFTLGGSILSGLNGDDIYVISNSNDQIVGETGTGGYDSVRTRVNYILAANIERLEAADPLSVAPLALGGNSLDNIVIGNAGRNAMSGYGGVDRLEGLAGDDVLDGGVGVDLMFGGVGNDEYYIDAADDIAIEYANEGNDIVHAATSYALLAGSHVEALITTSGYATTALNLTGNEFAQTIVGNYGNNILTGGGGADTLLGLAGSDEYYVDNAGALVIEYAGGGTDTVRTSVTYSLMAGSHVEALTTTSGYATTALNLTGNEFAQTIVGNYGNNILNGGGGADTLLGLAGSDEYYVDNAGDLVVEYAGEGTDTIRTSVSYTLMAGSHVEALTTTSGYATTALNLTGNEFAQTIVGNYGNNIINGGGGADTLRGLAGSDEYYVDNVGDLVIEYAGEGTDTIRTSVSYALVAGSHVEALTTTSGYATTALNLTGNEFAQTIVGNYGNNIINGGGGADTLLGLAGSDEYYVDNAGDLVVEYAGEGTDTIRTSVSYTLMAGSHVEALTTTSGYATTALNLTGNEFAQTIVGNYGNNILTGGGGADTLRGLAGSDSFAFTTALGGDNVDTIADFETGRDKILLAGGVGRPFAALAVGALAESSFAIGTAADANDHVIFNPATGQLFYDADGNGAGAALLFATVTRGTQLSAADFMVI